MTADLFQQLLANPDFLKRESIQSVTPIETIETHISYVILTETWAYKIKKTLRLPFLDFSTVALRKYYCQQELRLNQRLAPQMYRSVLPIKKQQNYLFVGEGEGHAMDYALKMRRMDNALEMDKMLLAGKVQNSHITGLAQQIADFHRMATVVRPNYSVTYYQNLFNSIGEWRTYFEHHLGEAFGTIIQRAIAASDQYLTGHIDLLRQRSEQGLVRDVHGDLHSKNIFLTTPPTVFDCIEFDEKLRQIDLLNEVAFLSMDLDFWHQEPLAQLFHEAYMNYLSTAGTEDVENINLFTYFKLYRASVRAKVLGLQAQETTWSPLLKSEVKRYLHLMERYLSQL